VANLKAFFDDPPAQLESIQPGGVRQYMTWRTKASAAYVRANREKALPSHIWNFARDTGYTAVPNPCAGIKGFREVGRDAYVEDDKFAAIWESADACLRDAMDLAYLTGQRPSDVLSISDMDVRHGLLNIQQAKTKAKLRLTVTGELEELLRRIRRESRPTRCTAPSWT